MHLAECGASTLGDIVECPVASVAVENRWILEAYGCVESIHFRERVAVYQQQILPTVIVEIEEAAAPAYVSRVDCEPCAGRCVIKLGTSAITIEGLALVGKVGTENVE